MVKNIAIWSRIRWTAVFVMSAISFAPIGHAQEISQIFRGLEITPVKLNLAGRIGHWSAWAAIW